MANNPQKIVIHNNVYQCEMCRVWKVIPRIASDESEYVYFCLVTFGANPNPQTGVLEPVGTPKPFCVDCFDTLGLTEDAPKIIIPNMQVPKDIKKN